MSSDARNFRVGLFVLAGIILVIGFLLLLGAKDLFRRTVTFETTFDESVAGLAVGSPVNMRGVRIGKVRSIEFVGDAYDLDYNAPGADAVLVRIDAAASDDEAELDMDMMDARVRAMVDHGLRFRLASQGLTGTVAIEGEYVDPQRFPPPDISWTPETQYVPSMPSTLRSITNATDRLIQRIETVDITRLLLNADAVLVSLNAVLGEFEVGAIRNEFLAVLEEMHQAVGTLNESVSALDIAGLQSDTRALVDDLRAAADSVGMSIEAADLATLSVRSREALDEFSATLIAARQLIDNSEFDIAETLENTRIASENLRDFSETAKSYPALLLRGAAPPRTDVPRQ